MKMNPIYNREMKAGSRSSRLAVVLTVFNTALAIVALTSMWVIIFRVRETGQIRYSVFLSIFRYVTWIEFAMIILIMPALTAGSLSGERERRTLDLVMTTLMRPSDIILGKLMSALVNVFLLVISGAPVIALVFVYGGVLPVDLALLFLCYFTAALLSGSIGMFFSAAATRTASAMTASYAVLGILIAGTVGLNAILSGLTAATRGSFLLLLASPLSTFYASVQAMTGESSAVRLFAEGFGVNGLGWLAERWIQVGLTVQVLISVLLLFFAARALKPKTGKN